MSETPKWYVVHTYSGYENKVATDIENAVENRKLHDLIAGVMVPTEKVVEIKDNKKREVERKIFPGYVLVNMIMTDDSWYVVRNIRGVTGFVGPGSKPVPLSDEEVAALGVDRTKSTSRLATLSKSSTVILTGSSVWLKNLTPIATWSRSSFPCLEERHP